MVKLETTDTNVRVFCAISLPPLFLAGSLFTDTGTPERMITSTLPTLEKLEPLNMVKLETTDTNARVLSDLSPHSNNLELSQFTDIGTQERMIISTLPTLEKLEPLNTDKP